MSRSDQIQEDLARAAKRANRLAQRARLRAERKAHRASEAAARAEALAKRAARTSRRRGWESEMERSIEDLVDDVTEKWTQKAEDWVDNAKEQLLGEDDDYQDSYAADGGSGGGNTDTSHADRSSTSRKYSRGKRYRHRLRKKALRARSARARVRSFRHRLRNGRALYRDPEAGKICGVCAGFAEYYGIETWQVRLGALLGLIFVPSLAFTGYFVAYFLMDKKPYYRRMTDQDDGQDPFEDLDDESEELVAVKEKGRTRRRRGRKERMKSKSGVSNSQAVRVARRKFLDLENRLRSMESHVTDSKFELQRELRKISGEK